MKKYIIFVGILFSIYFFNIKFEQINYIPKNVVEKKLKVIKSQIGIEKATTIIENIYTFFPNFEKIPPKQRLDLYSILSFLYLENTNYAKTSEMTLKVIKLSNQLQDRSRYVKAHIELALLFKRIGGYESGINLLKKIENINLPDKYENADKKVYTLFTLFQLYREVGAFQKAKESLDKIKKYQLDFSEEDWRDIEIIANTNYADLSLNEKNYKKTKEYLEKALKLQNLDKEEFYHWKNIPYNLTLGEYYIATNQISNAQEIYGLLLKISNDYNNKYLKIKVLKKLAQIESNLEKKVSYFEELINLDEKENNTMHENYTQSISDLINYELKIMEQYKIKNRFYRVLISLILLLGYSAFYLQKIKIKSEYDGMTSIFNRRKYDDDLKKILYWNKCGVIILDIDNFKTLNDTYGHLFGDEILITNATILKTMCKKQKGTKVYRYGGEEFIILCKDMSFDNVVIFAEKIRENIASKKWSNGLKVTVSIGVSHSDKTSLKNLFKKADSNLYISKKRGKNRVTSI